MAHQWRAVWGMLAVLAATSGTRSTNEPAAAPSAPPTDTLVLLDHPSVAHTHSTLLGLIDAVASAPADVVVATSPSASGLERSAGLPPYRNVVLLAPYAHELSGVSVDQLLSAVDASAVNVWVAASPGFGGVASAVADGVGFELDEPHTRVVDYFSEVSKDDVSIIRTSQFINAPTMIPAGRGSLLFRGVGMVARQSNPLPIEVLRAETTAYSYSIAEPITTYPLAVGGSVVLVGAMQARNTARAVVFGSFDMLSDNFFELSNGTNRQFAADLARWTFTDVAKIRVTSFDIAAAERRKGDTNLSTPIHAGDLVEVCATLQLKEALGDEWAPYAAEGVVVEVGQIGEVVSTALLRKQPTIGGALCTEIRAPLRAGVFSVRLAHHRLGYSYVDKVRQLTVLPRWRVSRLSVSEVLHYASTAMVIGSVLTYTVLLLGRPQDPRPKTD